MDGAADGKEIENLYHSKDVNIRIVISQAPQLDSKMKGCKFNEHKMPNTRLYLVRCDGESSNLVSLLCKGVFQSLFICMSFSCLFKSFKNKVKEQNYWLHLFLKCF
jgi:hypothetical protein